MKQGQTGKALNKFTVWWQELSAVNFTISKAETTTIEVTDRWRKWNVYKIIQYPFHSYYTFTIHET